MARFFEGELFGGVFGVIEDVGGGLVDRRCARAGRGVGIGAGMEASGLEAVCVVGHTGG